MTVSGREQAVRGRDQRLRDTLGVGVFEDLGFAVVTLGRQRAEAIMDGIGALLARVDERTAALRELAALADEGHDYDAHAEHPPEDGMLPDECRLCAALLLAGRADTEEGTA